MTEHEVGAPTRWRLLDEVDAADPDVDHMAADVALLDGVLAGGVPTLRLYTWPQPTLSLGHFQDEADVDQDACTRLGVRVARRPTGGAALLHGGDLTYAVAMPLGSGSANGVRAVYDLIASALIAGLGHVGVSAAVARHDGPGGAVCFTAQQGADLRVGDRKVCGSAQVRRRGAVLQHGSILLRRLSIDECDLVGDATSRDALRRASVTLEELGAPTDVRVVADAIIDGFKTALDVTFEPAALTEQALRARL